MAAIREFMGRPGVTDAGAMIRKPGEASMKVLLSLIAGGVLWAGQTRTLFDPRFDFSQSRTFSFISGYELEKLGILQNPETRDRIKNLIAGILEPRGLHEVPKDEKYDLAIRYWVGGEVKEETRLVPDPMWSTWGGYDPFWSSYWYMPYYELTEKYAVAVLVIDLLNPATKQLVWRTFLSQKFERTPETYRDIEKSLNKAFSQLPPDENEKKKMTKEVSKRLADFQKTPAKKP